MTEPQNDQNDQNQPLDLPEPDHDPESAGLAVSHLADEAEESLMRAARFAILKGSPLRMRIVIHLWTGRNYEAWRSQVWKVDARDTDEARGVKECLELFFDALAVQGTERLKTEMQEVLLRVKGIRGVEGAAREGDGDGRVGNP